MPRIANVDVVEQRYAQGSSPPHYTATYRNTFGSSDDLRWTEKLMSVLLVGMNEPIQAEW